MGIDKDIKNKFEERAIQPSASSWERLSNQLDMHAKRKRRRRFFYISSAASILLLVSIFALSLESDTIEDSIIPEKMIVETPAKTPEVKKEIDDLLDKNETIIAKNDTPKQEITPRKRSNKKAVDRNKELVPIEIPKTIMQNKDVIAKVDKSTGKGINLSADEVKLNKKKGTSRISVNSEALLYSVTHTEEEVVAYYKAHKIDREDVLNSIKKQLKKSNLKIDARTILADVERDIDDASFKENFMKIIKKRVSDLATAIASRND